MADSGLHLQIVKFGGENYRQWKFQIKCALRAKGIYEIAEGTTPRPAASSTDEFAKWNKNDATAMCVITSAMDLNQITLIEKCKSSKEILDKLDSIFELKTETNKMIVHERFYEYKMNPNDSVAQHVSKVENLAQRVKDAGETISDTAIVTKVLTTLPTKYLAFRQAWLSLDETKQTLPNLTARLLDEEANLNKAEELNGAFFMAGKRTNTAKKDLFQPKPKRIRCFKCGKMGTHMAKDCWSKNKKPFERRDENTSGSNSAFSIEEIAEANALMGNTDETWLMDSGASRHMTPHKHFFQTLAETTDRVKLGDNTVLEVKGIGTIRIEKMINGKWCDGSLENVWYIPGLKRNLFSEGTVTKRGFIILKGDTKAEIFENNKLAGSAIRCENNLYKMLIRVKSVKSSEANTVAGSLKEWHERLGHINVRYLKEMFSKEYADNVKLTGNEDFFCESCVYAKQHKLKFAPIKRTLTAPGAFCHTDVCGPMSVESVGGARYFVLFKDDSTAFSVVKFVKNKSDVYECLKDYLAMCKTKFGRDVERLRLDNGKEYINERCLNLLRERGVIMEPTGRYTPEQNGRTERENRTVVECARAMLYARDLPLRLWAEAVNTAVYLLNRTTTKQCANKTPFEAWTGKKPVINHTRIFGCVAYLHVPDTLRKKLDKKSEKLVFVGYNENSTNYRLFDPVTNKIKISRHVLFDEHSNIELPRKNIVAVDMSDQNIESAEERAKEVDEVDVFQDAEEIPVDKEDNARSIRPEDSSSENPRAEVYNLRGKSKLKTPKYLENYAVQNELNLAEVETPETYEEAMKSGESELWKSAMKEELDSLEANKTWELTTLPTNRKCIGSKWVFKVKLTPDNEQVRFKARLCAQGFSQVHGLDYGETFAPTTRYSTIRFLLALATQMKLEIMQFDVTTAFLYGEITEDIYMSPPPGTASRPGIVCKLKKSIYGLKQSPRCWNMKFNDHLIRMGLMQCETDRCVYHGKINNEPVILVLYVDDGLVFSRSKIVLKSVLNELEQAFKITTCEPKYFVGLEIHRNKKEDTLSISVRSFINNLLRKFKVTDAAPVTTPAEHSICLTEPEILPMTEVVPYRELVGSLIYLSIAARPDIAYVTGVLSRYLNNYGNVHWKAAKRVLRYLKGTKDMGIEYHVASDFVILGYSDADFAGDVQSRRSTTGFVFTFNGSAVTWKSQRQAMVTCSTSEAEYIAASEACKEAIWLKQLYGEICDCAWSLKLLVDNQSAIKLIRNPVFHNRSKHIDIRYHFIREKIANGDIDVEFVSTKHQIADMLTKPLNVTIFNRFRESMGLQFV